MTIRSMDRHPGNVSGSGLGYAGDLSLQHEQQNECRHKSAYHDCNDLYAAHLYCRSLRDEFSIYTELQWRWGYPAVLLVMATVGVSMAHLFSQEKMDIKCQ